MAGNVLFVQAEPKKMVVRLKAVGVSQIPLIERARNLVRIAVAVTHTGNVEIGFCAPRSVQYLGCQGQRSGCLPEEWFR